MLFLARFILRGQSQAALVAASMAILGLLIPPTAWISAAAIVLVTLVNGPQNGLITSLLALIGAAAFSFLLFSTPWIAAVFVLLAWLPAWIVATVLRQTVSLAFSLQVLTAISMLAVVAIYTLFPDFGEFWREPLDQIVMQLAEQSQDVSLAEMRQTEEWVIGFLPGLFASSLMFGTMISLFLGRWWQAVNYNPGGFAEEFQGLSLGKVSALSAILVIALAVMLNNFVTLSLATIVMVLYGIQSLSLLHAMVRIKKYNATWLFVVYALMFFIPQLTLLMIVVSLIDPWLDLRQRVRSDV